MAFFNRKKTPTGNWQKWKKKPPKSSANPKQLEAWEKRLYRYRQEVFLWKHGGKQGPKPRPPWWDEASLAGVMERKKEEEKRKKRERKEARKKREAEKRMVAEREAELPLW